MMHVFLNNLVFIVCFSYYMYSSLPFTFPNIKFEGFIHDDVCDYSTFIFTVM